MLADELAPRALAAAWGRQESVLAQDVAHGAVRAAAAVGVVRSATTARSTPGASATTCRG